MSYLINLSLLLHHIDILLYCLQNIEKNFILSPSEIFVNKGKQGTNFVIFLYELIISCPRTIYLFIYLFFIVVGFVIH